MLTLVVRTKPDWKFKLMVMKRLLASLFVAALFSGGAAYAVDDLQALTGKWSVKKTNDEGQAFTQTIEIKKDKYVFEILGGDATLVLHSEGDFKVEKLGTFTCARFFHIRAGSSASDMNDEDDEYVVIYTLDGDTWTTTSNFDKHRDGQKPSLDVYQRVRTGGAKAAQ
jgi:uncharacterized protein (TIGR03067 family)